MKKTPTIAQLDFFQKHLRKHGLRITPQRIAIYEELCRSGNHPTAEHVYKKVRRRFPTISLNTVNETLLTFAQLNLAEIIESFGGPRRYDPNLKAHHHVHCIKCGTILDFHSPQYDQLRIPQNIKREYDVLNLKVVLSGICADCRRSDS